MLRRLFALVVLLLGMLLPATASADATIYFEPRADGGWRISTPAEDYVAVPLGGCLLYTSNSVDGAAGVSASVCGTI